MVGLHGDHLVFAARDTVYRVPVRDISAGVGYQRLAVDPDRALRIGIEAPPALVREGLLFATRDGLYLRNFVNERPPRLLARRPDAMPVRDRRRSRIRGAGAVSVVGDSILVTSSERITCYRVAPARPADPEDRSER